MIKRKKDDFKFSDKAHPIQGIMGVIMAVIIMIVMGVLFYISSTTEGNAGLWIGFLGIAIFLLNILGFVLSVLGFRKQEIYYRFPIVGILMNGSLFVVFLLLYIVGI